MSKNNNTVNNKEQNGQKKFRSQESAAPTEAGSEKEALTREEHRTLQEEKSEKKKNKREKKGRLRIFPVWLKIIFSLLLFATALAAGLMFGYGIIGDGVPGDILDRETWYQIYDFIFDSTEHERDF